jgi:hypothetical protein
MAFSLGVAERVFVKMNPMAFSLGVAERVWNGKAVA